MRLSVRSLKLADNYRQLQVRKDIHGEIRKLALLNDIKIRDLATFLLLEILKDKEKVRHVIQLVKHLTS